MSFEAFETSLLQQVEDLQLLASTLNSQTSNDFLAQLQWLDSQLSKTEETFEKLESHIEKEKPYIAKIEEFKIYAEKQRDFLLYCLEPAIVGREKKRHSRPKHSFSLAPLPVTPSSSRKLKERRNEKLVQYQAEVQSYEQRQAQYGTGIIDEDSVMDEK
jgi:uncharacterized protein YozE (UPF0346 family)